MHTRRFFIGAVIAPLMVIVLIIFSALITSVDLSMRFTLTLIAPYLLFAVVMLMIGLKQPPGFLRRVSYRAPIVFLLFQSVFMVGAFGVGFSIAKDIIGLGALLIFVATYIVVIGYLYVFIAEQMYISYLYQQRSKNKMKFGKPLLSGKLLC